MKVGKSGAHSRTSSMDFDPSICGLLLHQLIAFDFAVADMNDPVCSLGDIVFMGDQDDGIAFLVEPRKQRHDFIASLGV